MGWKFRIDRRRRYVLAEFAETLTADDFIEYWRDLQRHPGFSLGLPRLLLFDAVAEAPPYEELRGAAARLREVFPAPRGRVALVASHDLIFGVLQMFEMLSESREVQYRVFREVVAAEAWLGLEPAAAPRSDRRPS